MTTKKTPPKGSRKYRGSNYTLAQKKTLDRFSPYLRKRKTRPKKRAAKMSDPWPDGIKLGKPLTRSQYNQMLKLYDIKKIRRKTPKESEAIKFVEEVAKIRIMKLWNWYLRPAVDVGMVKFIMKARRIRKKWGKAR